MDDPSAGQLIPVRHEQRFVAELAGEPAQLDEEPRVADQQVVFQVAVEVVPAQSVAQDGVALEAEQPRLGGRRVMREVAVPELDLVEHVRRAGRADDDVGQSGQVPLLAGTVVRRAMSITHCGRPKSCWIAARQFDKRLDSRAGVAAGGAMPAG